jgi:hypothetical protein
MHYGLLELTMFLQWMFGAEDMDEEVSQVV